MSTIMKCKDEVGGRCEGEGPTCQHFPTMCWNCMVEENYPSSVPGIVYFMCIACILDGTRKIDWSDVDPKEVSNIGFSIGHFGARHLHINTSRLLEMAPGGEEDFRLAYGDGCSAGRKLTKACLPRSTKN